MTKHTFTVGDYVVYPTHGVGQILEEKNQQIAGMDLKVFVIAFDKDKMKLSVPVHQAERAGLRHISAQDEIEQALCTLKGKAKAARGMWSKRAQEYETKINSGNIVSIAEVVRDLYRKDETAERSYSERVIYENALGRLAGEIAIAESLDASNAKDRVMKALKKVA